MVIETATLISAGTWIFQNVFNKGVDHLIDKTITREEINDEFYDSVKKTSQEMEETYPDILGSNINYFFKQEDVFNELIKMMFSDANIQVAEISKKIDTNTLPDGFIEEFITTLKKHDQKKSRLSKIFTNKKIYIAVQDISTDVKEITQSSKLTLAEVREIKRIIKENIGKDFDYAKFISDYSETAINNLSQVNYIGLGVDASIKRNRKKNSRCLRKAYFLF